MQVLQTGPDAGSLTARAPNSPDSPKNQWQSDFTPLCHWFLSLRELDGAVQETAFYNSAQMSRFDTNRAFDSMKMRRGSTSSPISVRKMSSACTASSMLTLSSVRVLGSIVVSKS